MTSSEMLPSARLRLRKRVSRACGTGRHHEDVHGLGHLLPHLRGALHIDVQQQIVAVRDGIGQRMAGRAVEVSKDIGRFEELAILLHALESRRGRRSDTPGPAARSRGARAWCS